MATRCNILVTKTQSYPDVDGRPNCNNGKRTAQYYRHWDGYPSGTGLDLALKLMELTNGHAPEDLKGLSDIESALRSKLTLDYERESHGGTEEPNLHGDIEWLYHIDFDGGITLNAHKIGIGPDPDNWEKMPKSTLLKIEEYPFRGKMVWRFVRLAITNAN